MYSYILLLFLLSIALTDNHQSLFSYRTREDVYTVLKRFEQLSGGSLAAQPRRYLERALLRRRKLGLDLPRAEDRKLVAELTLREKDLGTAYDKNLAEDNTALEFTPDELGTLPYITTLVLVECWNRVPSTSCVNDF